jgi:putative ABC transport system permease protein
MAHRACPDHAMASSKGTDMMHGIGNDIRFACRLLVKDRWMSLAAVTALALGLAANNAVFTIVNGLLLRDLPFSAPDRIVTIGMAPADSPRPTTGVSLRDLEEWRRAAKAFDGFGAARELTMNVADEPRAPERFTGAYISASAFQLLGRAPVLGRDFTPEDDRAGSEPVVILGHTVWRDRYQSDPDMIGRTIKVNGTSSMVVGVMPEGFGFPARSRVWQPLALMPASVSNDRNQRVLEGFGRVAAGFTIEQARADLAGVAAASDARYSAIDRRVEPRIAPFRERSIGGRARESFPPLAVALLFVLLIACANAESLLLVRAVHRESEIRVRQAVGASRGQIMRQLLIESVLLAIIAGVGALGLSLAGIRLFANAVARIEDGLPFWIQFGMDWRVFAFLAVLCLSTGIVFGLVPALHITRLRIGSLLNELAAGSGPSQRWMSRLVILQLVLTPILLTGAGLMVRSIEAQSQFDAGVKTAGIVRARLDLSGPRYGEAAARSQFYRQLDERLEAISNLRASLVSNVPFEGGAARRLSLAGGAVRAPLDRPRVRVVTIGRNYFATFGTRVIRGDDFQRINGPQSDVAAIVNERFAEQHFPNQDPVGRRIELTTDNGTSNGPARLVIVGVAPNIRQRSTEDAGTFEPIVYVPYSDNPIPAANVLVQSNLTTGAIASVLREQLRTLDPDLPLFAVMTLDESLAQSDERQGLLIFGTIFAIIGVIAFVLATLGVYGVTAYATAQRTREIGIRVALGAQARQIRQLISQRAFRQLARGLSIGMTGALGLGQLLRGLLIGTSGADPVTLLGVAAVLVVITFCAAWIPARRAARLHPVAALRHE